MGESGECLAFIRKRTNSYRGEIKCFSLVYNFVPREVGALPGPGHGLPILRPGGPDTIQHNNRTDSRGAGPPKIMFEILILEFYYNLSDVEVVKQSKFNVPFRMNYKARL